MTAFYSNFFVAVVTDMTCITEKVYHKFIGKHTCAEGHCNIDLIAHSLSNCFAKNELKWINQCEVELHAKMNRSLRQLSSKSTAKH